MVAVAACVAAPGGQHTSGTVRILVVHIPATQASPVPLLGPAAVATVVIVVVVVRRMRLQRFKPAAARDAGSVGPLPSTTTVVGRLQASDLLLQHPDLVRLLLERLREACAALVLLGNGRLHVLHLQAKPPHLSLQLRLLVSSRRTSNHQALSRGSRGGGTFGEGPRLPMPRLRHGVLLEALPIAATAAVVLHGAGPGRISGGQRRRSAASLELLDLRLLGLTEKAEVLDLLLTQLEQAGHELKLLVLRRHHERSFLVLGPQSLRQALLLLLRQLRLHQVNTRLHVGHLSILVLHGQRMLMLLDAEKLLVAHAAAPRRVASLRAAPVAAAGRGQRVLRRQVRGPRSSRR